MITRIVVRIQQMLRREEGASLVEYALLISLIAMVAYIAVMTFGESVSTKYSDIAQTLP
ncbi:MAG: Flp family type IVb pilin [Acidimicrobiia bacterium]